MSVRRLGSVVAAVLIGAVATAVVPAPAEAASGYCAKGTGVTVVVDKGALGGGTSVGCDPNGANTRGDTVVERAGFALTYVQRQPGFVCRIRGVPASDPCGNTPPGNAYWGLFYSNPGSGTWTYASTGVGSLKVAKGGFIGWKWQSSSARTSPGTKPVSPAASAPKPSPKPGPKPSHKPSPKPSPEPATGGAPSPSSPASATNGAAGPTASANRFAGAGEKARKKAHRAAKASAHASARSAKAKRAAAHARQRASASASPTSGASGAGGSASSDAAVSPRTNLTAGERANDNGSGLMLPLLAGGLVLVLAATMGRLLYARRRG